MSSMRETQISDINRTGSYIDVGRFLTLSPEVQADSFLSAPLTSGQRKDLLSSLSSEVKFKILSKNQWNMGRKMDSVLSPQDEIAVFDSFTPEDIDTLGVDDIFIHDSLTPQASDLLEKRLLDAEQRGMRKSTSTRMVETITGRTVLGRLARTAAVVVAVTGIGVKNGVSEQAKLEEFQRLCAAQFHIESIDCVNPPQYRENSISAATATLTPTSTPKQEMTATMAILVPTKPTEDTIEAWTAYQQDLLVAEKQAGDEHQKEKQELLKARNDEALEHIARLKTEATGTAEFKGFMETATSPVIVIETATATMTSTDAMVEPTMTATISADTLASAYEWAWQQKLGHLENGVLVLNAPEFRTVLATWLTSKGASEGEKRANIDVEMLSKPFGEKGMSLSHALDFWKKEGGRGWNPEDASHVFSFEELNAAKHADVFSTRNGENRLGLLVRAQDIKTTVVRMLAERQLRLSGMQDASKENITAFLNTAAIDKGIRQQASGLLRTVGVTVSANKLPSASESFSLQEKNKMPPFALRITRGGKAVNRDLQPETAECVVYLKGLEETNGENNETMRKSDLIGDILVAFTESNDKIVVDVFRFTNIEDVLAPGRIQPLADDQAGQPAQVDGGRWIDGCFVAGPAKNSTLGPDMTPGVPTLTPGMTLTPGITGTPGETSTPVRNPSETPIGTNVPPPKITATPAGNPTDQPTVMPTEIPPTQSDISTLPPATQPPLVP